MLFFFKQKTAYELRISDWSSDVCSSDLLDPAVWRRFDHVLHFKAPDHALIEHYLAEFVESEPVRANLAALLVGESFSAIGQLLMSSRKSALLEQRELVPVLLQNAIRLRLSKGGMAKPHDGEMLLKIGRAHV